MKTRKLMGFGRLFFGATMLLAAAFILSTQFGWLESIGVWSVILGAFAIVFTLRQLIRLKFASLPLPLAALYIVFHKPFGLPYVETWTLLVSAALLSIGLSALLPGNRHKLWKKYVRGAVGDATDVENGEGSKIEYGGDDNNPTVSVKGGSVSRYLHSECMETAKLECRLGSLEAFFEQANLSPQGAKVFCKCNLGSITLYVPKEWKILSDVECHLGSVDITGYSEPQEENPPTINVYGNVSLGSIEIKCV